MMLNILQSDDHMDHLRFSFHVIAADIKVQVAMTDRTMIFESSHH